MHEYIVWEGRFQPIHRGHVAYIDLLLRRGRELWIYVVADETSADVPRASSELPVPEFTALVDEHHGPHKNPLPFAVQYGLVTHTLASEFPGAPIIVWGGRRLDLDWPFCSQLLPRPRIFLTPLRDDFEDAKAAAWTALGETVERVDVSGLPEISGTQLRRALKDGSAPISEFLCPATLEMLDRTGYLAELSQ
jgi:hypothetical protein